MKDLDGLDPTDPRFDELLDKLMTEIRHHVEDEETDLFPAPPDVQRSRTRRSRREDRASEESCANPAAPSAPDKPPMNKILAPGAGLIDKMRDALSGRTT